LFCSAGDYRIIWQAKAYQMALRRYLHLCRQYRNSQPKALKTLHAFPFDSLRCPE